MRDLCLETQAQDVVASSGSQVLRYIGNQELLGLPAIGICGSRDATDQSLELAGKFSHFAAQVGYGVVSGNARGVDEAAQLGVLESGGWTAIVLAEGMGRWAPRKSHRTLITHENFVAVSTYADDAGWLAWRAMARNKVIVALSQAVVVVQARTKGGTWNAGLECLRQEEPLLVVQRREESPETEGGRKLIAKGGIGVTSSKKLTELLERLQAGDPLMPELQGRLLD